MAEQAGLGRVIDKYNAKVFRVRFEKKEDVVRLQDIGIAKLAAVCSRALLCVSCCQTGRES